MKQRNYAFDLLCGLCIVRMVSLHVMAFCGHADDDCWREVMQWTYFFMSFFFFKAGYFNKSLAGDSRQYCLDKTKRLLIPWATCGAIGSAVYFSFYPFLLQRYHHPIDTLEWSHVWMKSSFYGNNPVWFLMSFWASYIVAHFLEKWTAGWPSWTRALYMLFPFASYGLYRLDNPVVLQLNNLFIGIYFFQLGRFWHRAMERMGDRRTLWVSAALTAWFVVGNIVWHDARYTMANNEFQGNVFVTLANTTAVLCGLAGLLIAARLPRIPLISYVGEHSMVYFISHYPMLFFYKFTHLCFGRSIFGRWDDVIILLPALFMICSWLVPYIEGNPWLSGRWPKPKTAAPAV
ncbi:MAG: acyltransferase [Bacteroidaceae bacterium]|nr:acyltransferase [Bacteroidaceae bacterium]